MASAPGSGTLILSRADVAGLLPMPDCIAAVEAAFARHARGEAIPPAVLGTHVEGGGFHVKAAGMHGGIDGHPVYAAKVNANFPANPDRHGLPTIQGVLALFDASDGRVLALMDSIELTVLRTAAATAVAARHLAPPVVSVAIVGCGYQARSQLRALACVRPLVRVTAIDTDRDRAAAFAREMSAELGAEVTVAGMVADVARGTNLWVTCTPAQRWFLGLAHVAPGSFVAAVGADNPEKQEIEPALMGRAAVIPDIAEQCAAIGDLHHAINAGAMRREDVRAELGEVVAGMKPGRLRDDEIVVFDSTGTALQDVAAAVIVHQRALEGGVGLRLDLGAAA
jgi:ornithine cyclodeaminase/alanine dehydrogenase-like protein (mu-crystallin family)